MRPPSLGMILYQCMGHITSVCVVLCVHMYSFAGSIRRRPQPTFSDTTITDRQSDSLLPARSTLGADSLVYLIWKTSFGHMPPVEVEPSNSCITANTLSTRQGTPLVINFVCVCMYSSSRNDVPRVAQWYGPWPR